MTGPQGTLVLVIGPSGVGKTTVLDRIVATVSGAARFVTSTTRAPRAGEVNGVHYHFLSRAEFERQRDAGGFLEWNEFSGNLYGSSRAVIDRLRDEHALVLGILDVNGARKAMAAYPDIVTVFLLPESMEQLRARLAERAADAADVDRRLRTAEAEIAQAGDFSAAVVNREGDIDGTARAVLDAVEAHVWHRSDAR